MSEEILGYINEYFDLNGIKADEGKLKMLADYLSILLEVNSQFNLTAIRDEREAALKHITDCALIKDLPLAGTLLDVGSGGGLPSVPLAILRPELAVTALDSTGKKVTFLSDTAKKLGLRNFTAVCGRAEELSRTKMRDSFDNVTARAVANMTLLSELCLPFVRKGGMFIAMKSRTGRDETASAKGAIVQLGGKIMEIKDYTLKGEEEGQTRTIITVAKIAHTPDAFPRTYARMIKKPL
ncbi:MAG: 16S rRNA (guanine(527)-N(7))-methyltransferase RsmG [Firmicutes bacterium]|nr:16S rRNA (guanine(527)-N(7))-methyltransferase RsmG [Candidatus Colimorpha enterica]